MVHFRNGPLSTEKLETFGDRSPDEIHQLGLNTVAMGPVKANMNCIGIWSSAVLCPFLLNIQHGKGDFRTWAMNADTIHAATDKPALRECAPPLTSHLRLIQDNRHLG
jgi:hypothetical protein